MDRYLKVLNTLLDEIDFLDAQLQEALEERDYELAHRLQEIKYMKIHALYELENIFIPVRKGRSHPPDRFVVNNAPASSVFADHLKAFLQKDTDILALQLNFKREYGRSRTERLSIYQNPLTRKVNMILTKPDPYNFQLAILKHIGWRRDEEVEQRFTCELAGRKNKLLRELKLVVARTLFEVIDKSKIKTELKVVRVK